MPPFGPTWFGPLQDPTNPIGGLRLLWIVLNTAEDRRLAWEERKAEIEYGGFFANPSVYRAVMDQRNGVESDGDDSTLKIVRKNTEYGRLLNLAMSGTPEIHEPRQDIAELVIRKRREMAELKQSGTPQTSASEDESDDLIIERKPPKKR